MARFADPLPDSEGVRARIRRHIARGHQLNEIDGERLRALDEGEDVLVPVWEIPAGIEVPRHALYERPHMIVVRGDRIASLKP